MTEMSSDYWLDVVFLRSTFLNQSVDSRVTSTLGSFEGIPAYHVSTTAWLTCQDTIACANY